MKRVNKTGKTKQARGGFVRTTITIPEEIAPFAEHRSNDPEHAGNMSSYVRTLILQDRKAYQKQAA